MHFIHRHKQEETIMLNLNQFLKKCARGSVTKTVIDIEPLERNGVVSEVTPYTRIQRRLSVFKWVTISSHMGNGCRDQIFTRSTTWTEGKSKQVSWYFSIPVNQRYTSDDSDVFTSNFGDDIFITLVTVVFNTLVDKYEHTVI